MSALIRVNCPSKAHRTPKLLCLVDPDMRGDVYVSCKDSLCRRTGSKGNLFRVSQHDGALVVKRIVLKYRKPAQSHPIMILEGPE